MPTMITAVCAGCSSEFTVRSKGKNRPPPKYCGRQCYTKHAMEDMRARAHEALRGKYASVIGHKKPRTEHCRNCGLLLDKKPSAKRKFCSRECAASYHRASSIPKADGNIVEAKHHTLLWQRRFARERYGNKCSRCGYDRCPAILQVHHKDRVLTNHDPENIDLMCPNCHEEEHFANKTGRFNNHDRRKKRPEDTYRFVKNRL